MRSTRLPVLLTTLFPTRASAGVACALRRRVGTWLMGLLVLAGSAVVVGGGEPGDAEAERFFEKRVRPLLVKRCFDCHGPGTENEAGLRLDSLAAMLAGGRSGPAIKPGDPDASLLVLAVRHDPVAPHMPPKSKLPFLEIADLVTWIRQGARWPGQKAVPRRTTPADDPDHFPYDRQARRFWAFRPPARETPPGVADAGWVRGPIDRFVLARLEAAGIEPALPADRRMLIRRATLDLHGMPPAASTVADFLADDSPAAFARLVDRLLASPRYGHRWGRRWLDVVRYADSNGMDDNLFYADAWRYRDWVIQAFNDDKPFDRLVVEQIAGDLLLADPGEDPEARYGRMIATGFLTLGPKMLAEDDPVKQQMDIVDDQIDTLGRAFLGLTLGCARCHDHKFDPLPTSDYYALAGIFTSTRVMLTFRVDSKWNARALGPDLLEQRLSRIETEIDRLDRIIVLSDQSKMSAAERKSLSQQLDRVRAEYASIPKAMAVDEGTGADLELFRRGNHLVRGPKIPRRFPRVLAGFDQPPVGGSGSGRLELARWIVRADHPLTARVLVNRVWLGHFGEGLVRSPDNFGRLGERPDNRPLLDWLARRFVADGWSIKRLHRRIMLSAAYRMSTAANTRASAVDPENRLLWRMNRRRMQAEVLRDSLLAVSGRLDETIGGSLIDVRAFDNLSNATHRAKINFDSTRRSIYLPVLRSAIYDVFQAFDFPDPAVVTGRRSETTVAPQALFLMNGRLATETAGRLASNLIDAYGDPGRRLTAAYLQVLGRPPRPDEQSAWRRFLDQHRAAAIRADIAPQDREHAAWQSLCRVLVSSNEFVFVD